MEAGGAQSGLGASIAACLPTATAHWTCSGGGRIVWCLWASMTGPQRFLNLSSGDLWYGYARCYDALLHEVGGCVLSIDCSLEVCMYVAIDGHGGPICVGGCWRDVVLAVAARAVALSAASSCAMVRLQSKQNAFGMSSSGC